MEQMQPADVAPGLSEGQAPGAQMPEGATGADQLRELVSGVQQGLDMLRGLIEATPDAPEEAGALLDAAMDSFMQSMQLMVGGGGEDEMAAEAELPVAPEAALAQRPAIRPKGMGTL